MTMVPMKVFLNESKLGDVRFQLWLPSSFHSCLDLSSNLESLPPSSSTPIFPLFFPFPVDPLRSSAPSLQSEIVPTTMPLSAALAQRNRRQEASHLLEVGAVEDLLNRPDGTVDPHLKAFAESIQTHAHLGPGGKKLNKKGNPSANGATGEYVGEISGTSRTAGNGAGGESSEAQTSRSGRRIGRKSVGEEDGVGSAGNGNQSRDEDFEMNDESSSSLQAPPQVPQQQQPSVLQPPTSTTAPQQEAPSQNGNANSNAGTSSHLALPSSD